MNVLSTLSSGKSAIEMVDKFRSFDITEKLHQFQSTTNGLINNGANNNNSDPNYNNSNQHNGNSNASKNQSNDSLSSSSSPSNANNENLNNGNAALNTVNNLSKNLKNSLNSKISNLGISFPNFGNQENFEFNTQLLQEQRRRHQAPNNASNSDESLENSPPLSPVPGHHRSSVVKAFSAAIPMSKPRSLAVNTNHLNNKTFMSDSSQSLERHANANEMISSSSNLSQNSNEIQQHHHHQQQQQQQQQPLMQSKSLAVDEDDDRSHSQTGKCL